MSHPTKISRTALCQLADLEPKFFSRHPAELPEPTPIHDGKTGRPSLAYDVADLAEFAQRMTCDLSEAELRLQVAFRRARAQGRAHRRVSVYRTGAVGPDGLCPVEFIHNQPRIEDSQS